MINNTRQRKIYGLQVLVTPTSLSLNNTHPWVFTYSYVPRFLPVLYALELVLIAFFFLSYFCNPHTLSSYFSWSPQLLPLRGMRTAVGHWIVFLFPSVSLYFPNFSVKSLGRLPERPLVCLVKGWFTISEWALGTISLPDWIILLQHYHLLDARFQRWKVCREEYLEPDERM